MNASVQLLAITAVNAARAVFGSAEVLISKAFPDGAYTVTVEVSRPVRITTSTTYPRHCDMPMQFIEDETHRIVCMLTNSVVARATEAACRGNFVGNSR